MQDKFGTARQGQSFLWEGIYTSVMQEIKNLNNFL